jgi:hypothetical protein
VFKQFVCRFGALNRGRWRERGLLGGRTALSSGVYRNLCESQFFRRRDREPGSRYRIREKAAEGEGGLTAQLIEQGFERNLCAGVEKGVTAQGAIGCRGRGVEAAEKARLLAGMAEGGGILIGQLSHLL